MNKAELIEMVSKEPKLTSKETGQVLDAIIGTITDTLRKGEKVTLVNFGTFQVMERKARRGVNPRTRKIIQIPAKKVAKFVPGKGLREKWGERGDK